MIDDQLAPSPEEVAQCLFPVLAVEDVVLLHKLPRQIAPFAAELVAQTRELLLLGQVLFPRREPVRVRYYSVSRRMILLRAQRKGTKGSGRGTGPLAERSEGRGDVAELAAWRKTR